MYTSAPTHSRLGKLDQFRVLSIASKSLLHDSVPDRVLRARKCPCSASAFRVWTLLVATEPRQEAIREFKPRDEACRAICGVKNPHDEQGEQEQKSAYYDPRRQRDDLEQSEESLKAEKQETPDQGCTGDAEDDSQRHCFAALFMHECTLCTYRQLCTTSANVE